MANVILYTRVSTDEQAEKGFSLRDQLEKLEKHSRSKGYTVVKHFQDDHSAKTFDRPEFIKLLAFIKSNKGLVKKLLIVKWDRFSRNLEASMVMISKLQALGVSVEAIEQPLDDDVPENLLMKAFYLAAPQVENARRSLNTFNGMRKALKEGRWVSTAPIGYKNARDILNKPIVVFSKDEPLVKKAFELFATGLWDIDALRKEMNKKGLQIGRNRFWLLLRNPFYYGMIQIKEHRDEKEELVKGLHPAIISEELFNEVQYVLSGKKKQKAKKAKAKDELPLRGFLVCSCCGKNLTGSASKGNGGTYYYYHCQPGCKERYKSDILHSEFNNWLKSISIKPEIASLYIAVMEDVFKTNEGDREAEIKKLNQQIVKNKEMQEKVAISLIDGGLDKHDYKMLKEKYAVESVELKNRIEELKSAENGFAEYSRFGFSLLSNLSYHYNQADLANKQKLIGLIFPEKLIFSNGTYRTKEPNQLLGLMCNNINELDGVKKKKTSNDESLSLMVARRGIEPLFEE